MKSAITVTKHKVVWYRGYNILPWGYSQNTFENPSLSTSTWSQTRDSNLLLIRERLLTPNTTFPPPPQGRVEHSQTEQRDQIQFENRVHLVLCDISSILAWSNRHTIRRRSILHDIMNIHLFNHATITEIPIVQFSHHELNVTKRHTMGDCNWFQGLWSLCSVRLRRNLFRLSFLWDYRRDQNRLQKSFCVSNDSSFPDSTLTSFFNFLSLRTLTTCFSRSDSATSTEEGSKKVAEKLLCPLEESQEP
jgi:hypothetical protein